MRVIMTGLKEKVVDVLKKQFSEDELDIMCNMTFSDELYWFEILSSTGPRKIKYKPCPACGGDNTAYRYSEELYHCVYCRNCSWGVVGLSSELRAIKAWNTRHTGETGE